MFKFVTATALSLALVTSAATAQNLQPTMSAQDVRAAMEPTESHVIVPILAMIMILATAAGTASPSGVAASDARLKTDITRVGTTAHGLALYDYSYIGLPDMTFRGVMAQEVQAVMPDAVLTHRSGYLMVDYDALGLSLDRIK